MDEHRHSEFSAQINHGKYLPTSNKLLPGVWTLKAVKGSCDFLDFLTFVHF